jgi:hypothetical protein
MQTQRGNRTPEEVIQRKEAASIEAIPRSVTFNPEDKIQLFDKESVSEIEVNLQLFLPRL